MQAQTMDSRTKKRSERLEQLIRIYESGQVSELMDQTLDKLFSVEAATVQSDIDELRADLLKFEEIYSMKSEIFYAKFEAGEMGDDADLIEWASYFDMYRNAKNRLAALSGDAA